MHTGMLGLSDERSQNIIITSVSLESIVKKHFVKIILLMLTLKKQLFWHSL